MGECCLYILGSPEPNESRQEYAVHMYGYILVDCFGRLGISTRLGLSPIQIMLE
jgi:hypothetical protein